MAAMSAAHGPTYAKLFLFSLYVKRERKLRQLEAQMCAGNGYVLEAFSTSSISAKSRGQQEPSVVASPRDTLLALADLENIATGI